MPPRYSGGTLPAMRCLLLPAALLLLASSPAWADEAAECAAHGGTLLADTVLSRPTFRQGHDRRGVELSHTHLRLDAGDGRPYDIAIDDVFAQGYDSAGEHVPAPLSAIGPGTRIELCGKPYASGGRGMDWVHTSCGNPPSRRQPDGWVKIIGPDGAPGPNLEDSQEYCRLW